MKYILIIFLVLILPLASATRINLSLNQSYSSDGRNVTLIDLSKDKALICVNNEKAIISKDKIKTVNNVNFDLKKVYHDRIIADVKVYCKDCECTSDCNNIACVTNPYHNEIQEEIKKENTALEIIPEKTTEIVSNQNTAAYSFLGAFLILVIFISGIYYLLRRR